MIFLNKRTFYLNALSKSLIVALLISSCGKGDEWWSLTHPGKDHDKASAPEISPEAMPDDPAYKSALVNNDYLISSVNLRPWLQSGRHGSRIKIAILDNGFGGLENSLGKHLPPDLQVFQGPISNQSPTPHGTKLAEVIFAMTSGSADWTSNSQHPTLKLYNANGFSNFSAAVDQAIRDRVDMIVYSQVWEFGGNFDGRGFINAVVNKAVSAGILWINAAGNYATSSWQGGLIPNADKTAKLPYSGRYVRLAVNDPSTPVKISLSWNDFADSKDWRTSRDLDLVLLDGRTQRELTASRKIQDGRDHSQNHSQNNNRDGNYSAHAREAIETTLPPGEYLLRVDIKSLNFDSNSRIRLSANGQNISFIDQSPDASVMIPADNPNVLTVGASDDVASSAGVTNGGIQKPEVVAPSMIQFESGITFQGSSSAAAVAAATLAVYQDVCGRLTRQQIVAKITNGLLSQRSTAGRGLWLPATGRCL